MIEVRNILDIGVQLPPLTRLLLGCIIDDSPDIETEFRFHIMSARLRLGCCDTTMNRALRTLERDEWIVSRFDYSKGRDVYLTRIGPRLKHQGLTHVPR